MKVAIYKTGNRWAVTVNNAVQYFDAEDGALEFIRSIAREMNSAVNSAIETYLEMKDQMKGTA